MHNHLSGKAMLQVIWLWYRRFVDDFRKRLGLPAYTATSFFRALRSAPMLSANSPSVIPHPSDWPDSVHITGYFFLDTHVNWQPSPELNAFLKAGDPPVYIGFGSMAGCNPEQLAKLVLEALTKSNQRGLLLTGCGDLRTEHPPEDMFVVESAPHRWLFTRVAAVEKAEENGYVKRLMCTIKEEEVDLSEYLDFQDALNQIGHFIEDVYMTKRIHSSLGYFTPVEFENDRRLSQLADMSP